MYKIGPKFIILRRSTDEDCRCGRKFWTLYIFYWIKVFLKFLFAISFSVFIFYICIYIYMYVYICIFFLWMSSVDSVYLV